jgi:hypothetical protein
VSLFVLSPEIEDRGEVEVATGSKKCFNSGYKKKATSTVSTEIHQGAIFDRVMIKSSIN